MPKKHPDPLAKTELLAIQLQRLKLKPEPSSALKQQYYRNPLNLIKLKGDK